MRKWTGLWRRWMTESRDESGDEEATRQLQERVAELEKVECRFEGAGGADGAEDASADGVGDPGKEWNEMPAEKRSTRACWTRRCRV